MDSQSFPHYFLYAIPLLLPIFILLRSHRSYSTKPIPHSSSTATHSLLGILPQFLRNRHRFLEWVTEIFSSGPTMSMVLQIPGQVSGVVTADPRNVEHILKNNFVNYPKGERNHLLTEDFLGDGIFTSDGELWRTQRKTAIYEFSKRSLRNFVVDSVQFEIENRLLPLLGRAAATAEVVDLQDVLERFALDNICKVAFGVDPGSLAADDHELATEAPPGFMQALDEAQTTLMARFFDALPITWRVKRILDVGSERRHRISTKTVHDFATAIVRKRLAAPPSGPTPQHDDLLSRFVSVCSDRSEEFLRDVVVNFMVAGRDTTSTSLTWFFWLLSSHPDARANILRELESVKSARKDGGEHAPCFSFEELQEMHYLHAAITESLRLYPPVAVNSVSCKEEDVLPDGMFVGKGWFVIYSAYSMGRMQKVWGKDCCKYRPERWLEEGVFRPESPYKFPAFHGGPRMCLGKEMAYIQMKSVAASVVERCELEAVRGEEWPGYVLSLTLKMKGGLPVRVKNRG